MADEKPIKIMLSSTVRGNELVIESIYGTLHNFGYDVLCSHIGTIYTPPGKTTEEASLQAVEDCDFFFGIIFPYYGSGITHLEIKKAVELNKPRGFLAHANIPYTRTLLKDFMFDKNGDRTDFELIKKTTVLDSLKVVDMYNDAIGHNKDNTRRFWAQQFYKYELDGAPFVDTQFIKNAERFRSDLKRLRDGE